MATETNHRLLSQQQMILPPLFWNQRTQTGTELPLAAMLTFSHRPAPTRTQTEEARKTQVPPSSLNREPFKGLTQRVQKSPGPAAHRRRIRPLYKHPRQLELSLRHRQKAASCLV